MVERLRMSSFLLNQIYEQIETSSQHLTTRGGPSRGADASTTSRTCIKFSSRSQWRCESVNILMASWSHNRKHYEFVPISMMMPQYSGKFLSLVKLNEQPRVLQAAELNFSHSISLEISSATDACQLSRLNYCEELWKRLRSTRNKNHTQATTKDWRLWAFNAPCTLHSFYGLTGLHGRAQSVSEKQFMTTAPQVYRSPKVLTFRWPAVERSGLLMSYSAHSNAS